MRLNLRDKLFGALVVVASGEGLEKFINNMFRRGIVLWDISRLGPDKMVFKINPEQFRRLRPLTRRSGIRLKIKRKIGIPFQWLRLAKRKGIIVGFVLCSLIIYALSSFVWFVDVSGNKKINTRQVLQVAQALGVKPGIWRQQVDTTKTAREIKERIPQTAWVGVTLKGTRVHIQIVEKKERPAPKPGKGNLIAAKTGLVSDVLVIKGVPQVAEGQTVKKGQPLIAAANVPAAQGFVRARVWYTGVGTAKLVDEGVRTTGNTSTGLRIKIGTKVIILTGKRSPFALYKELVTANSLPQWRNIHIPVEILSVQYQEMTHYKKVLAKPEALKAAEAGALKDLQAQLPEGVKVLSRKTIRPNSKDPNIIQVQINVETLEEIAVHQDS